MDSRKHIKLILLALSAVSVAIGEVPAIQWVVPLPSMIVPGKPQLYVPTTSTIGFAAAPAVGRSAQPLGFAAAPAVGESVQPLGFAAAPAVGRSEQPLGLEAIPEREDLTDEKGNPNPWIAVAAAPVTALTAKLLRWTNPVGGSYMDDLKQSILVAEAAENIQERDRLFAIYEPWAEKYLNPDSPTWVPPDEQ